jgi:DNA-binding transcriptional LysR family regulator
MLDLESVRLFILVTEFGNLTRAAEAAGTVQPVVSQRLKALEGAVGRKLQERTPRFVRLTPDGTAFLTRARALLAAHDAALGFADAPPMRLALGLSDHATGAGLEQLMRHLRTALPPHAVVEVRLGMSQPLRTAFDAGELDAAILRREGGGPDGEFLGPDPLGWRAAENLTLPPDAPVPLATLGPPCGVRAAAIRHLEGIGRPWREVFIGGSCAALLAAVKAGLGIAPMGAVASGRMPDRGPALGLPSLPPSGIILHARAGSPDIASAMRVLEGAMRAVLRGNNDPERLP